MFPPIYDALLGIQAALGNSVAPQLRAVTLDVEKNELFFFFFYDGEVTDELFELASCAVTEVDIHPPQDFTHQHIVRLDCPETIPIKGKLAFLRKEQNSPEYKKESRVFLLKETLPIVVLLLDMQEALLGKVTPSLRHVAARIDPEKKQLAWYFTYDENMSDEDVALATAAMKEASVSFPGYQVDSYIDKIDSSVKFNSRGKRAAYMREEFKFI